MSLPMFNERAFAGLMARWPSGPVAKTMHFAVWNKHLRSAGAALDGVTG